LLHRILTAEDVIAHFGLRPLEGEGGLYRETYRLGGGGGAVPAATAIYYLLTPDTFSELHRLPNDEIYHFYLGDAVELLQLGPGGTIARRTLGSDLLAGMEVQAMVASDHWQGSRLRDGGRFALMGTTMTPGFRFETYERGDREGLRRDYPTVVADIDRLTRG